MLDRFSAEVDAALRERYPQWAAAIATRAGRAGGEIVAITVPRPVAGDVVGGLVIDSDNGEITVQCGQHYHSHFGDWGPGRAWDEAFAFIDGIVGEEAICARFERGPQVLGGSVVTAAEARAVLAGIDLPTVVVRRQPDLIWLWSWRGTFDAKVRIAG